MGIEKDKSLHSKKKKKKKKGQVFMGIEKDKSLHLKKKKKTSLHVHLSPIQMVMKLTWPINGVFSIL